MNLYKQEDLQILEKKKKLYTAIYVSSFALILICSIVGLLITTYYSQIPQMIICSIVNVILFFLMVFYMDKNRHIKHLIYEYQSILLAEIKKAHIKVVSISDKPITLADSSMCYEISVLSEGKQSFVYLSEVFDKSLLEVEKEYDISLAFDYIKEINYED